jgi:hypothetical protein
MGKGIIAFLRKGKKKNRSFFKVPSIDNTCTVRVQSCLLFLRKCFNHFSLGFCVKNYCGGHLGSGEIKN